MDLPKEIHLMTAWDVGINHRHQSSMLSGALDASGKFGKAKDAAVSSWAWGHVETATTLVNKENTIVNYRKRKHS